MKKEYLFYTKGSLKDYLEKRKSKIKEEIYQLDENYILNVSEEDLVKALVDKYTLITPTLKLDKKYLLEPKEIDVDVSKDPNRFIIDRSKPYYIKGTLNTLVIPFEGDEELFYYQLNEFPMNIPLGAISHNELHLSYEMTHQDPEYLKKAINKDIENIQYHLNRVKIQVDDFNNSLESYIRNLIKTRKDKLIKDRNLLSSLNIPIKKRADVSFTYSVPVKQKRIKVELPIVKDEKFEPEPTLAIEIYEDILKTIKNMALVMERSPKSFSKMKEETLRDHFLVQLNGLYEGEAMGEVFNFQGKTDILIRHNNKNIFIAECKFWRGDKNFIETINQILKYTTWRDTKTAILLFNKKGNLTKIIEKIPQLVSQHDCYKRTIKISGETEFCFVFSMPNDPNREIIMTIMVFDIPKINY